MSNKLKVCVVGDGGWGTALGLMLFEQGCHVTMWGPFAEYIDEVHRTRCNSRYLPDIGIPEGVEWTSDTKLAVQNAKLIILAVPSHYFSDVCRKFKDFIPVDADVVSVSKGFCRETGERLSVTASKILGIQNVAVLSGPSHAEEVARRIPTAVVAASADIEQAERVQGIMSAPYFRIYTTDDSTGVELGGAIKNVIALAVGMSDGMGFGDNSRAALITRGLAEMARLGTAMGGKPETFAGLSGIGDLVVTCTSRHSRNRSVGERLGKGESLDSIVKRMKQVAEGVWNCPLVTQLAGSLGVEMPLCEAVRKVLDSEMTPDDAVAMLMERDNKQEDYA